MSEQDRQADGVSGPEPVPGLPADQPTPAPDPPPTPAPELSGEREPTDRPSALGRDRGRGRMSFQDENTTPREPTLAEQRAHQQAERKAVEDEQARLAEEARQRKKRKRLMIGGGAVAGVAALAAIGYAASRPDDDVEARCVDRETKVVVDDSNCVQPAANAGGGYGGGFFPIFIGGFGRQYNYNYGGGGSIGQTATGGTTVAPRDATVRSGTSGRTIQRGGFGVNSSSGSGGKFGSSGS